MKTPARAGEVPTPRASLSGGARAPLAARIAITGAILASPLTARAQLSGEQALAAADATRSNLPPDTLGGEALFGQLDEDFFVTLALRLNFDRGDWGVGLQVPLRLRVVDNDPQNDDDFGSVLRREDWDEPSDFLRILRYVYIGQADKKGPFYVRLGELSGLTVGHGTIMYRYFNGIDPDVWHTGVNAAVNVGAFGAEAVVGDLVSPYVVGGRVTVRPLELALGEGLFWEKLVVGTSFIADASAPYTLATTATGAASRISLDEHNHPNVAERKAVGVFGVDVGLEVVSTELLSITPYVDLNKMTTVGDGWGLHLGVLWGLRVPLGVDTFVVDARTEYRRVSGDYSGPYFNTTYEIERHQVLGGAGALPIPKLRALDLGTAPGRNGVFFDLLAGLPAFVFVGGEFVDYDGGVSDGTLRLSLEIPALEVIRFSAFYYRINIDDLSDLFALDDKSAIVAQAQIPMYSVFTLNLRWWRVWRPDPTSGGYESADDWSVGVGFKLEL